MVRRCIILPVLLAGLLIGCGQPASLTSEDVGRLRQLNSANRSLSLEEIKAVAKIQYRAALFITKNLELKVQEKDYDLFFRAVPAGALEKYPLLNDAMSSPIVLNEQYQKYGNRQTSQYDACEGMLSEAKNLYWIIRETQPQGVLDLTDNGAVNMQRQKIDQATQACSQVLAKSV
ncbi:hypothetical protein [Chromobacterium sphagni]|uniref:DUF4136 domain-containing protein n=1 Tax=Chromobacterium sphagni TaxID=1903179 RepID=A0ABX3CGF3_9NEIS|nr:hypothetical protein [Chromobacterium sphagni]OHX21224.1 hypothetical protein BI344_01405 [Chromobacterium sphagni]